MSRPHLSGREKTTGRFVNRGFTLVELLVVISIIALLVAILLPSLQRAKEQAKSLACLSNVRSLAQGVMTYATEYEGRLPGPLHPAIMRDLAEELWNDTYTKERQLTWKLRQVMSVKGAMDGGANDLVAICPVMDKMVPKKWFEDYRDTGKGGVYATNYCLNTWATDMEIQGSISVADPDGTSPGHYFGYSHPSDETKNEAPKSLSQIKRSSDEWMLADAWYRPKAGPAFAPRQEGSFQTPWTGNALPNFAPHGGPFKSYRYTDDATRSRASAQIRSGKSDGKTNTGFFDGHAEPVRSKAMIAGGQTTVFYGFRGTVNPDESRTSAPSSVNWQ